MKRHAKFVVLFALLAAFFGFLAFPYIHRYHLQVLSVLGIYCCFVTLLALVLAPAALNMPRNPALFLVLWCSPYLLYAVGTRDFRWLALAHLVVAAVPLAFLYYLFPVRDLARFTWQDLLIAIWLIAVLLGRQLTHIWTVPVNLDFMGRLFLIAISSWSWVYLRPLPGLGYHFTLSVNVLRAAAWNFLLFALIAIPSGLALHFTAWNPQHVSFASFAASFTEIFLFIALLEELFFRGFLQTLISQTLGHPRLGQALAACLFGLFHILHAPFPNWRYVLLATVAGWFYGSAFAKTGSLLASALTHALVDTLWRMFLSKT